MLLAKTPVFVDLDVNAKARPEGSHKALPRRGSRPRHAKLCGRTASLAGGGAGKDAGWQAPGARSKLRCPSSQQVTHRSATLALVMALGALSKDS